MKKEVKDMRRRARYERNVARSRVIAVIEIDRLEEGLLSERQLLLVEEWRFTAEYVHVV